MGPSLILFLFPQNQRNTTQNNTTQVPLSAEQTADGKWVLVSDAQTHVKLDAAAAGQQ